MGLTKKNYAKIKEELDECKNPLFFFHDDADGLCSFLLLYRYKKEGKGVIIKTTPKVDKKFLRKVEEYCPDKIFILDIALVEQDFLDEVNVPVIWVDHHGPYKLRKVKYFNPRVKKSTDNTSVTELCYNVVKQDMWIAMVGAVGDWQLPKFAKEFTKEYPDLLDKSIKKPEEALFNSEVGKIVKIISFMLKGNLGDVMKCVKILTRIETPQEILKHETPQAKFIYRRYEKTGENYALLLKKAMKSETKDKLLLFTYMDGETSFTKELSNELLYRFPKKVIMIGREKSGEMKMSIRASQKILPPILEKSLDGVEGYGGGHEHACGACVKIHDYEKFVKQFRENI